MRYFFVFILLLVFSVPLIAGEVNLPHTFQPNTKAKASEVNANFNAVRDAVNDNNSRIQSLENFRGNIAGSSCQWGEAVIGFTNNGTPQCEDMNKDIKILSVTYPASCFAAVYQPARSLPVINVLQLSPSVNVYAMYLEDKDGASNYNSVFCPIVLPEGSSILKVIVHAHDNTNTGNISITLVREPPFPANRELHNIGTTNDGGDQTLQGDFTPNGLPIVEGSSYFIRAGFNSDNEGTNLRVYRVIVIYEYDPTYSSP